MKATEVLTVLRLEDGRLWAEAAHDFQLVDARAVLQGVEPYSFLTRARGASKTTDLAACALAALLAAEGRTRAYWLASDSDQGALAIDCIAGFVGRSEALRDRVDVQARKIVVPDSGASLEVLAADAPGAWGLNPHWIFTDELANWSDGPAARRLWEAASSAVAKRKDARLVVLTTAGSPDHFSFKVLEHARQSPLWRVSERLGPAPWMDEDRLFEQRQRLPEAVFAQLFLNEWTAAAGSFLDRAVVAAAFCLDGPTLEREYGPYCAALDLGSVNDRTVFALGHRDGDRVLLDRMMVWQGSRRAPVDFAEVERFIVAAHQRFGFTLRLDPWQGLDLAQRLRAQGIIAEEFHFSPASKQRLAATLLSTINNGDLWLYEADGLREELLGLRLTQTSSGAWCFDHARGGHDDRAVALAMMTVALLEVPAVGSGAPVFGATPARSVHDIDGTHFGPRPLAGYREIPRSGLAGADWPQSSEEDYGPPPKILVDALGPRVATLEHRRIERQKWERARGRERLPEMPTRPSTWRGVHDVDNPANSNARTPGGSL